MKTIVAIIAALLLLILTGCNSRRQASLREDRLLNYMTTDSLSAQAIKTHTIFTMLSRQWVIDSPSVTITLTDGTLIQARAQSAHNNSHSTTLATSRDSTKTTATSSDSLHLEEQRESREARQQQSAYSAWPLIIILLLIAAIWITLKHHRRGVIR